MGELYGLVVHFDVLPGHEAAFDALVAETIEKIRLNEPDTLVYISHKGALSSPIAASLLRALPGLRGIRDS